MHEALKSLYIYTSVTPQLLTNLYCCCDHLLFLLVYMHSIYVYRKKQVCTVYRIKVNTAGRETLRLTVCIGVQVGIANVRILHRPPEVM